MVHDPSALPNTRVNTTPKDKGKGKGQDDGGSRGGGSQQPDQDAITFPDGKFCCFAHLRGLCTLGRNCPKGHGKATRAMLAKRDVYEAKNGKLYENWPSRSAAGGKGTGKGDKTAREKQKGPDGKDLPISEVGCNYLARGLECPKGEGKCKFSHDAAHVASRKKFLAKTDKKKDSVPKAKA